MRTGRRSPLFVVIVSALLLTALAPAASVRGVQSEQTPLPSTSIAQFIDPLPLLDLVGGPMATLDGTHDLTLRMCEFRSQVVRFVPPEGSDGTTWVWGYLPDTTGNPATTCADLVNAASGGSGVLQTYIGPVVLAERGVPTQVTWINELGNASTTNVVAYRDSTDQTLHWADPGNDGANECAMSEQVPEYGSDCAQNYAGSIPAVAHLHGGEVPADIDGGPDAWFTADGSHQGHGYYTQDPSTDAPNSAVYRYPNGQEAAPLWFHDHALGVTRLDVYAGLAGGWLLADPDQTLPDGLAPYGLQRGATMDPTIPLVIQDRSFDTTGQLFFPSDSAADTLWTPNPDHPYWVPEFTGDTILVNGKAWPYLNVEPKRYRFLFLNGSNARTYEMALTDPVSKNPGPSIWVISTDGGYLDAPVEIDPAAPAKADSQLLMMPGERYEAIVDFSGFEAGQVGPNGKPYSGSWLLRNTGRTPYPFGDAPHGTTTGRVMLFRVGQCLSGTCGAADTSYDPADGIALRSPMVRLADPASGTVAAGVHVDNTRLLTLNEVLADPQTATDPVTGETVDYEGGPLEVLLNNTEYPGGETGRPYDDFTPITVDGNTTYYSELPMEGETEVWEIVNTTADAHPIHLHLVQFQLLNRQKYNTKAYDKDYAAAFPSGAYQPAFGPPQDYRAANNPLSGGKDGGNPDVDAVARNGRPLYLQGPVMPPNPAEAGWKDTIVVPPGQVTRLIVRWAPTDLPADTDASDAFFPFTPDGGHGYVWHCHILDHEDNEMMRPYTVEPNPDAVRTFVQGTDY